MHTVTRRLLLASGAVALCATAAVTSCQPTTPVTPTPTTTTAPAACATPGLATTVAYKQISGIDPNLLSLDIHAPARACNAPVVLWVHGGGYQIGDKANQMPDKVKLFNSKGWILVSINYRLTAPGSPTSAKYPEHYQDVAAAVAWVHDGIEPYGGDPDRIALLGHSAGADIVANVAAESRYLEAEGLGLATLDCIGPLDTEGFDKVTSVGDGESAQWSLALGNDPDYLWTTSATRIISWRHKVPATIGVVRGSSSRRAIEAAYLAKVAGTGARTVTIEAAGLSHAEVASRIGAPGDTVMTPPLVSFLTTCFKP